MLPPEHLTPPTLLLLYAHIPCTKARNFSTVHAQMQASSVPGMQKWAQTSQFLPARCHCQLQRKILAKILEVLHFRASAVQAVD